MPQSETMMPAGERSTGDLFADLFRLERERMEASANCSDAEVRGASLGRDAAEWRVETDRLEAEFKAVQDAIETRRLTGLAAAAGAVQWILDRMVENGDDQTFEALLGRKLLDYLRPAGERLPLERYRPAAWSEGMRS